MRTVYAQKNKKIILGIQGEDKAVRVVWPGIVSEWSSLYGDGSFQLSVRRFSDENAYPVVVEVNGDDIRFTVTSAETAIAGIGKCELTYIANGSIAKSATWETVVLNSLTGQTTSEPPEEPAKSWFTAIQGQIGNLNELETTSKDNLVAAINEAARTGGGAGSMDLRVADGYVQYSTDSGSTWQNLIAVADLEGADGITPTIGANGNWYLGDTDTGKPSRGEVGPAGADGADGAPGADGKSAYQYAVDGGYTGTETEFAAKLAEECIQNPPTASVGQTIVVKAVGENGKPTAWEAADMPSGGTGASYRSWSNVWTLAVAEDIAGFEASNIDLDGKSEIMIVFISDSTASRTMVNGRLIINGVDAGKVLFNSLPLRKDSHSFVIIGRADEGIEYTTMAAKAEYQTYPWQGDVNVVHRMVSGTASSIMQWTAGSTIKITQASATLGQGVTIKIYVR